MQSKARGAPIILTAISPRNDTIKVMPVIDRINAKLLNSPMGRWFVA
jgi:hypothetical protein